MKILVVCGTRPDAIKLAPIYHALQARLAPPELMLLSTGQHRELLDQVLQEFQLEAHIDLAVMRPGQDLTQLTARMVSGVGEVLAREAPSLVVTHGDTATAFAARSTRPGGCVSERSKSNRQMAGGRSPRPPARRNARGSCTFRQNLR